MTKLLKVLKFLKTIYPLLGQGHRIDTESERVKAQSIKLRKVLQELGPTYVKLGQILSVRYDLLHRETCNELQVLLDSGAPIAFSEIKFLLEKELGARAPELLTDIDPHPLAVASIAQVYKTQLPNGSKVVIKVQKPGIHRQISEDLKFMRGVVRTLAFIPSIKRMQLGLVFRQFEEWTLKETDFTIEAANIGKFREAFKDDNQIYIPKVYRRYLTDKVLVTEYIEGPSIKQLIKAFQLSNEDEFIYKGKTYSKHVISEVFARNVFQQVFSKGVVHGDPHPSNLIMKEPGVVTFIDFGILTVLTEGQRDLFKHLVFNIVERRYEELIEGLIELDQKSGHKPKEVIKEEVVKRLDRFSTSIAEEYSPTAALTDIMYIANQLGIEYPMFLVIIGKVIATYDGMLQIINPSANIINIILPFFEQEVIDNKLKSFKSGLFTNLEKANTFKDMIFELPEETLRLLRDIEVNGIKIQTPTTSEKENYSSTDVHMVKIVMLVFITVASFIGFLSTTVVKSSIAIDNINAQLVLLWTFLISWGTTLIYILKK